MRDDDIREENPAWGLVSFSRVQGGNPVFFGSDVPSDHYITLQVGRASRRHSLGQDWIMEANGIPIVEVAMTSHQFAELLTSMNVGSGVPCTIRYADGKSVKRLERIETEGDRIKAEFKKNAAKHNEVIRKNKEGIDVLLAKDKLSKADRNAISGLLSHIIMEMDSNRPFYLDQFEDSTAKMVVQAKAEVDAFVTHVVVNAGLEHLRGLKTQAHLPAHDTTRDIKETGKLNDRKHE